MRATDEAPDAPHACRDPRDLVRDLSRRHETAQGGGTPGDVSGGVSGGTRPQIAESWRRSRAAGAGTGVRAAPPVLDRGAVADARAAHPLGPHLPMLGALLGPAADASGHLLVVTDEECHVLWTQGPPAARRAAGAIGLAEGFCWSEGSVGTNGIGTALAAGRPEYVYAAEHLAVALHGWSCAGAPVIDPDTGRVVGCVDVSGTVAELHPATVALVAAAARLAASQLEIVMLRRDERLRERVPPALRGAAGTVLLSATGRIVAAAEPGWQGRRLPLPGPDGTVVLPDGRAAVAEPLGEGFLLRAGATAADRPLLSLSFLGADRPHARLDGAVVPLGQRHAEILTLLALHPRGLDGDRLALLLYGEDGSPGTVRAEIHRLRARLGPLVRARPYRLDCAVDADFRTVRRMLDEGDVAGAVRLHGGELLPRSDAPGVRAERDELAVRVRRLALAHGGPDTLWEHVQTEPGRGDLEALQRLAAVLPPGDSRRAAVESRAARLLAET
ncbi:helix-turn-helix domain-containing protein [Spirillospora albida]|uniref:helix-turn-helix domain-containing protein n=1 Tax=Spirillospora albida TaxID=58123 RepID=UPI0004BF463D|nr:helix-turn-helix domain-containing protein [Spirillospora albida]